MNDVLVLGAAGQLGQSLQLTMPPNLEVFFADRSQADVTDTTQLSEIILKAKPKYIINCVAYTAVDKAETEVGQAHQLNAHLLADIVQNLGKDTRLIHISTDFVFSGKSRMPYKTDELTEPQSVYGESKLAGEKVVLAQLPDRGMIIRTSWLYSEFGNNFVKTMLRLIDEREELSVVGDQIGSPTYAVGLAELIWAIISKGEFQAGVFHWSDQGETTWFGFASEIAQMAKEFELIENPASIKNIPTTDYPTPAARPKYSVLEVTKTCDLGVVKQVLWQDNLRTMLLKR